MTLTKTFSEFQVGDMAVFEQSFTQEAFADFAGLSGDHNPLHHDASYAAQSEFERPIVPMHMTMAPLSRIAGMIFPGDPSLYLGHELRSILPVFYGDVLTYSAKVTAVNPSLRTLSIRVLVCRGAEVVLDAQMQVMSRLESWEAQGEASDLTPDPEAALITGATGEIGTALALTLAQRGLNLVLVDRGPGAKRDALARELEMAAGKDQRIDFITADLCRPEETAALCAQLVERGDVTSVFHSASPPLTAPLQDLVAVNYGALQQISEAVLPAMLVRQQGVLANIGSVATERVIPGWHDYSAAKAMAGQFLSAFDKSQSGFGLRGLNILSGLVATEYSASAQGSAPAMLPQELAEAVVEVALDERAGRAVMIEWNGRRAGEVGFHDNRPAPGQMATAAPAAGNTAVNLSGSEMGNDDFQTQIEAVVRGRLRSPQDEDVTQGGLGISAGWDSLRHIELVLEMERVFGIRYNAGEIEKMLTFQALAATTQAHLSQK